MGDLLNGGAVTRTATKVPWVGPRVAVRLHRRGLGALELDWPSLAGLVEQQRPTTLSVDVFDTCVVRDLVGDEPIELAARHRANGAESIADSAAQLERELCRPVPSAAESLARIRQAGTEVVFLSDTDRTSAVLRDLLVGFDLMAEGDRLIASCEAGATKSRGDLFTQTWSAEATADGRVWHVGNNLWSDVAMAEQAGLRAFPLRAGEPTRYEHAMAARPETAGPAVAGAARTARLALDASGGDRSLEVLGAQIAGQAFGAFLLWAAEETRARHLSRLAFLSRDAELLLDMARAMPRDHWEGVSFGYLHCSRWSWVLAGAASYGLETWLAAGTADENAFIHSNRHRAPLSSLLGRIGLDIADLGSDHRRLRALGPDQRLPVALVDEWEALLADPAIGELILARATERRDLLIDYLHTVELPEGPIGLVDVGWRGRLAWAMSPILAEVTGAAPVHLHFGGDKALADVDDRADIIRFAFDRDRPPDPIGNPVSCVETLTASGRARVVGYGRSDDGSVQPMFEREVTAVRNADRRRLWHGAIRAARNIPTRDALVAMGCSTVSLAPEAHEVLALWWTEPSRTEAAAMRNLSFEADDDGRSIQPLVSPYSMREVLAGYKRKRQWREGSAAISGRPVAAAVGLYRHVGDRFR